ncbi:hypothetical protein [Xanthobacter autotrophicus]|uniref:hypothetical protein n=1 Tax=Xanthobacter autotrophicus TaxID=280 RepID=UPI00372BDD7E
MEPDRKEDRCLGDLLGDPEWLTEQKQKAGQQQRVTAERLEENPPPVEVSSLATLYAAPQGPDLVGMLAERTGVEPADLARLLVRLSARRKSKGPARAAHRPNENMPAEQFVVVETLKAKGWKGGPLTRVVAELLEKYAPPERHKTTAESYIRNARTFDGKELSPGELEELASRPIVVHAVAYEPAQKRR